MSVFIVPKRHIDALITYAKYHYPEALRGTTPSKAGQSLWDENYRSFNTLYETHDVPPKYKFTPYSPIPSAAQVLKALHCLGYQCYGVDNHPKNYQNLYNAIHAEACRNVIGYEEAQWKITE